MTRLALFFAIPLFLGAASPPLPRDESFWQRRYCEGMKLEHHLSSGGYVDCLSDEHAIEVEWAEHWAEAVWQSLYYASGTGRKPGIILLCESSEGGTLKAYAAATSIGSKMHSAL